MVEQIIKNIYRIPVPLVGSPLKNLNAYLVRGEERSLLIDTGFCMPQCREAILGSLAELGVDMARTDIFLTHLHSDHTGLAPELASETSRVFLSAVDRTGMPGKWLNFDWEAYYATLMDNGFPKAVLEASVEDNPAVAFAPGPFDRYESLAEGANLSYGGYTFTVLDTPGHTPGHQCLYEPKEQLMFLGDHVLFDITPNITAWSGVENSLGDYKKSLERVLALPVKLPLPGHRTVHTDLHERIRELLDHHERRCNEAMDILRARPGLTAYEVAGKMSWSIRCRNWEEFPAAQRFFAVGEAIAHLDDLTCRGRLRMEVENGLRKYYPAE